MSLARVTASLFCLGALALLVAGCGSSSSSSESTGSTARAMTVSGAEVSGLGTVLVDAEGLTVYQFGKDTGTTSTCFGACEQSWPPVIAKGQPTAGEGATTSALGTTKRKDGSLQVTYAGHPLYTFAGDTEPGEANGNESEAFGGKWSAMDESGEAVAGTATESEETESSSGGYGY